MFLLSYGYCSILLISGPQGRPGLRLQSFTSTIVNSCANDHLTFFAVVAILMAGATIRRLGPENGMQLWPRGVPIGEARLSPFWPMNFASIPATVSVGPFRRRKWKGAAAVSSTRGISFRQSDVDCESVSSYA